MPYGYQSDIILDMESDDNIRRTKSYILMVMWLQDSVKKITNLEDISISQITISWATFFSINIATEHVVHRTMILAIKDVFNLHET